MGWDAVKEGVRVWLGGCLGGELIGLMRGLWVGRREGGRWKVEEEEEEVREAREEEKESV